MLWQFGVHEPPVRLWQPVHTRRCVLRHQLASKVDLRRVDERHRSTRHWSRRAFSMWGVQLSSVGSTYQLQEWIDFLAPQPRQTHCFSNTGRFQGQTSRVWIQTWAYFFISSWFVVRATTQNCIRFFTRETYLEPFDQTGFNLNEPADILLFLKIRPFFLLFPFPSLLFR